MAYRPDKIADLQQLLPLEKQIAWLNLSRTKISNEGLKTVGKLATLRQLHLEYTGIDDAGMPSMSVSTRVPPLVTYSSSSPSQVPPRSTSPAAQTTG